MIEKLTEGKNFDEPERWRDPHEWKMRHDKAYREMWEKIEADDAAKKAREQREAAANTPIIRADVITPEKLDARTKSIINSVGTVINERLLEIRQDLHQRMDGLEARIKILEDNAEREMGRLDAIVTAQNINARRLQ